MINAIFIVVAIMFSTLSSAMDDHERDDKVFVSAKSLIETVLSSANLDSLRKNMDMVLEGLPSRPLNESYEINKFVAKLLVAVVGARASLEYLSTVIRKNQEMLIDELKVKGPFELSFFYLYVFDDILLSLSYARENSPANDKDIYIWRENCRRIESAIEQRIKKNGLLGDECNISRQIFQSLMLIEKILRYGKGAFEDRPSVRPEAGKATQTDDDKTEKKRREKIRRDYAEVKRVIIEQVRDKESPLYDFLFNN